jgi:DNA-binding transcriptional MocR family regulator
MALYFAGNYPLRYNYTFSAGRRPFPPLFAAKRRAGMLPAADLIKSYSKEFPRGFAMEEFPRIKRLPPYVFNVTGELKLAARRRGEDIIDFSMGNPDQPTPRHIVDKLVETVMRPDTHGYSVSKGILRLRKAICNWYQTRFGVELDPETEAIVTIG